MFRPMLVLAAAGASGEAVGGSEQVRHHLLAAAVTGVHELQFGVRPGLGEFPGGIDG